jgi:hypothetical protein
MSLRALRVPQGKLNEGSMAISLSAFAEAQGLARG